MFYPLRITYLHLNNPFSVQKVLGLIFCILSWAILFPTELWLVNLIYKFQIYLLNIVSIVLLGIFNLTFINRKLYQMDFVFLRISLLCTRNSGKEILCTALLFYHSFMTCKTRSYLDCFRTKMYCSLKLCELFWFIERLNK